MPIGETKRECEMGSIGCWRFGCLGLQCAKVRPRMSAVWQVCGMTDMTMCGRARETEIIRGLQFKRAAL